MPLRLRVFIILGISSTAIILVNIFILYKLIYPSFVKLEKDSAKRNAIRFAEAIKSEIKHLDNFCNDWATWNDSYQFIEDSNTDFIESNLVQEVFLHSNLNIMCFYNIDKELVWGKGFDKSAFEWIPVKEFSNLTKSPLLYSSDRKQNGYLKGIIPTSYGLAIISSRPILQSSKKGPARGTLLVCRFLNEELLSSLKKQTKVDFKVLRAGDKKQTKKDISVINELSPENKIVFIYNDNGYLEVYTYMTDVFGNPALFFKVFMQKDITSKGLKIIHFSLSSMLILLLIIIVVRIYSMNKTVLAPITSLIKDVLKIQRSQDTSLRLPEQGDNELTTLTHAINKMLNSINESHDMLKKSEDKYHSTIESLTDCMFATDADLVITLHNKAAESLCNKLGINKDINGKLLNSILPFRKSFESSIKSVINTKQPVLSEDMLSIPKRSFMEENMYTETMIIPVLDNSDILNIIFSIRDITERKKTENPAVFFAGIRKHNI